MKRLTIILLFAVALCIVGGAAYAVLPDGFKLSSELEFLLPAYNTTISGSDWLYCDSFEWSADNTTFTMTEAYMQGGLAIDTFAVSTQNANLTLNTLGMVTINFDLNYTSSTNATVTLTGLTQEPTQVIIDGAEAEYTYTDSTDTLSIVTEGENVNITYPKDEDDLWVVGLVFGLIGLSIAMVALVRRKNGGD